MVLDATWICFEPIVLSRTTTICRHCCNYLVHAHDSLHVWYPASNSRCVVRSAETQLNEHTHIVLWISIPQEPGSREEEKPPSFASPPKTSLCPDRTRPRPRSPDTRGLGGLSKRLPRKGENKTVTTCPPFSSP